MHKHILSLEDDLVLVPTLESSSHQAYDVYNFDHARGTPAALIEAMSILAKS